MKKIISVISLIIIAAMLMATPVFGVEDYERDYGQDIFKGNQLTKAPVIDGKVSREEYGQITSAKTEPNAWMHSMPLGDAGHNDTYDKISEFDPRKDEEWEYLKNRTMKQLDTWFAYDDENIYVAYYQLGGAWDTDTDDDTTEGNGYDEYTYRNNYVMRMGFNMGNAFDLIQMEFSMPKFTSGVANLKAITTDKQNGIRFSFTGGNSAGNKFNTGGKPLESCTDVLVAGIMSKYTVDGTPLQGSVNSKNGQYVECVELAFSKKAILKAYNEEIGTDLAELPEAMWFFFAGRHYSWKDAAMKTNNYDGQTMWFGAPLSMEERDNYGKSFEYYPDLVILGDNFKIPENTTETTTPSDTIETTPIAPPDTDTGTTQDTSTDTSTQTTPNSTTSTTPSGEDLTESDSTTSSEKTDDNDGCKGTVTAVGVVLTAALGCCAVFVEKKKK